MTLLIISTFGLGSCGGSLNRTDVKSDAPAGPFRLDSKCPIDQADLIPIANEKKNTVDEFVKCVRLHSDPSSAQAASWISDWYKGVSCIQRCDETGIDAMIHGSLTEGLRYIIAVTLSSTQGIEQKCLAMQLQTRADLDETVNYLAGWPISRRDFCRVPEYEARTIQAIAAAQQYRMQLSSQIKTFKEAHHSRN